MNRRHRNAAVAALLALSAFVFAPAAAQASFGVTPGSFHITAKKEKEGPALDFQAGSHPYEWTLSFAMNQNAEERPDGTLTTLIAELPPGLTGNPTAIPRCTGAAFEGGVPRCPGDTQVGMAYVKIAAAPEITESPLYNITPRHGAPAALGFSIANFNSFQEASVRSGSDFGISVSDITVPNVEIQSVQEVIWGVPASPEHYAERRCPVPGTTTIETGCESDAQPPKPFFTMPTSCAEPLQARIRVASLQEPGVFQPATAYSEEGGLKAGMSGCNKLGFEPSISFQPTTNRADSPSGLDVDIHQPQDESPEGLSTAQLKDVSVALPQGLSVNPSSANGLGGCTEAQIGYTGTDSGGPHFSESPQSCPSSSRLGTLEVTSPLLGEFDEDTGVLTGRRPLHGSVFLAQPFQNPFGALIALYLAVEDPQTGIVAKLAGRVEPDPGTGQLTSVFTQNPQLPLEDIKLSLFEGDRASLTTPIACGTHTTTSTLTPWSAPEGADAHPSSSFETTAPASGQSACPGSEAAAPDQRSLSAGTTDTPAGAYSPFVMKLTRPDGSQRISSLEVSPPPGLLGRLAGVSVCSEGQIAQAIAREAPDMGAAERSDPSCPASSEVGTATVGAGSGPSPFYVTGNAYLAGPYRSAPASLVFITPAIAGPFDLGTVVVRAPIYVNPATAQITVKSDPIPQVLDGIPLDVRSIAVKVDRPDFALNPTNCEKMSVGAGVLSATGSTASLTNPFQVGGCGGLPFKPHLKLYLKGGTRRAAHPKLIGTVYGGAGQAGTSRLQVKLPRSAFLDQAHIRTVCTRVQFAAGGGNGERCPKGAVYGHAWVKTPLLSYTLQGKVFLRSSNHKLPDLVLALHGPAWQPIALELDGKTDSVKGALRNTFEAVPDAPFTQARLVLYGGKRGLVVNSRNLCARTYRANVRAVGQNGKIEQLHPLVRNQCGKAKSKKKHGGHHRKR